MGLSKSIAFYGASYHGFYSPMKLGKLDAGLMHQNGAENKTGGDIKWRMSVFACDMTSDHLTSGPSLAIPKTFSSGLCEDTLFLERLNVGGLK